MAQSNDKPLMIDDIEQATSLETRIPGELRAAAYPCFRQLSCFVRDGVLVLNGQLPSYYLKQLAQTVVRPHLSGTMIVDNRITVANRP